MYEFKELRELIVLEQFKQSLVQVLQTHLNDVDVKIVFNAAEAADNYFLIHRDSWREKSTGQGKRLGDIERRHLDKRWLGATYELPERWATI